MKRNVVIYQDEGVEKFGLDCLREFFKDDDVWLCTAESVIDGRILHLADIFVMPGGADLPYCEKLDGEGNDNIRAYVEEGGTYLGICAGAYYGCAALEFHKGREDEISGPRELAFAPVTAVGSVAELAKPYDLTLDSAAVITLQNGLRAYYHGGPYFRLDGMVGVIAYYDLPFVAPAIISSQVGQGKAILSGVHFEIGPDQLVNHPEDQERGKILASQFSGKRPDWQFLLFSTPEQA